MEIIWRKIFLVVVIIGLSIGMQNPAMAQFTKNDTVAVMDFGTRPGATTSEISIQNAEYTSSEYIINALVKNGFYVQDKDLVMGKLNAESLNTTGIIDPDTAKRIGEILGVRYIVYGNIASVTTGTSGGGIELGNVMAGVDICTVKAHIIARVMDVETGDIVKMMKGDGESKSSYVEVGSRYIGTVGIGTKTVTMDSVHNAIRKAGEQIVEKIK